MTLYSRKMLFPHRYEHSISCFLPWIVFFITISVQCFASLSDNLIWNITSNPVKFGNTAELSCFIFDYDATCTDELRQWIGGQQYTSLCQNMRCADDTKYHVKLRKACSYSLIISNFSMDDVNYDYSCFYGTHSYRKHLQLNSNDFMSVPRIKYKNMSLTGGVLDIYVSMKDAYPDPKCHALLAGKSITNSLEVMTSTKKYFYDVDLHVNHQIRICGGNATIYCFMGKEEVVVLNEYIDDCSDIPTSNSILSGDQVAGIIAGVVVAVISICIGVYLCRKKTKRNGAPDETMQCIGKPLAPVGPMSISNITESSADIEWQAPEHDSGAPVNQYQIDYRQANTSMWKEAGKVDRTTYNFSVKNLNEYQEYYFKVTAINSEGNGSPLESVDLVKLSDKPSAPVGSICISYVTDSSIYLEWQAPTMDGGAPVERYQIDYRLENTSTWKEAGKVDNTTHKFRVKNLKEYQVYYIRVTAVNTEEIRSLLESVGPVKLSDKPSAPAGPMSISKKNDSSVYIECKEPLIDGGAPVDNTKYNIDK